MVALGRVRRFAREWLAAALGLTLVTTAAVLYFRPTGRETHRLTLSAGRPDGLRHQIAQRLVEAAARSGLALSVVATSGSEEALDRVNSGALDLALVQGGLDSVGWPRVRQVASMKIEPLHLVVKAEIEPDASESRGLDFLRGRTVNLGEVGSGTNRLAREVLDFAGLRPSGKSAQGDYTPATLGYRLLLDGQDRNALPDAVFTVSALPSPVVKHLVTRRNYRLVPLRFGEAFALDSLHGGGFTPASGGGPAPSAHGIDRAHVYATEIPAYTYSVALPVPPRPVPTFGTRLLVVARDTTHPAAVTRLLEAGYATGSGGAVFDPSLIDLAPELDWHKGALAYRDRNKPLIIGDAIDFLEKSTSLLGGVLGGAFFLWQWRRQRVRRRRELGFESYILKVTEIERRALNLELAATLDLRQLLGLQVELSRLKAEALQRFADGELEGEELVSGFLAHVNDARGYLARLTLHERDNIEEKAARRHRSTESAWREALGEIPGGEPAGEVLGP
jgi:TRAP-type uncharacterized transport system substrate-binding protein